MSITTVKANHCDVCGYEWLKTAKTPKRCANPGCRERNWDRPTAPAKPSESLPRDQRIRSFGIQHTPTCKCLACRANAWRADHGGK